MNVLVSFFARNGIIRILIQCCDKRRLHPDIVRDAVSPVHSAITSAAPAPAAGAVNHRQRAWQSGGGIRGTCSRRVLCQLAEYKRLRGVRRRVASALA